MDTKRAWIEKLMAEAQSADDGRRRLTFMVKDAKTLSECAAQLSIAMHKLASDESVSCAAFQSESDIEDNIDKAITMATTLVNKCREIVTAEHLLAIKKAKGRE